MVKITSTEFVRTPGLYQDQAQREPVVIMKHNCEHTVIVSAEEYRRLKRRDRLVYRAGEIPEELIDAIKAAAAPDETAAFDAEFGAR